MLTKTRAAAAKKIIRAPKGRFDKLFCAKVGERLAFTDGRFLAFVFPEDLPPELAGFAPSGNEPEGYTWTGSDRTPGCPDVRNVIPKAPGVEARVTGWTFSRGDVTARLIRAESGPVFVACHYFDMLMALYPNATIRVSDTTSPIVGMADDGIAFLLMPLRADNNWADDFGA